MPKLSQEAVQKINFTLNGDAETGLAEPRMLLSDFLRNVMGVTGCHVGCEHGVCGACTVQIDGKVQRSCLTLAVQVEGRRVDTVESLAGRENELTDLQQAFKTHHGLQCGYCTPGMIMAAEGLLRRNAEPADSEIRLALAGNICRCTGYVKILKAVHLAVDERKP